MISKTMRTILHALSYGNIEVEASRRLADIKKLDAMRIFFNKCSKNSLTSVGDGMNCTSEHICSQNPYEINKNTCFQISIILY